MAHYTSVRQTAQRFQLSERRVQALCHQGRLSGALFLRGAWLIPDDAMKPVDLRLQGADRGQRSTEETERQLSVFDFMQGETLFNLSESCDFLGINESTGQNWLKSGRLQPSFYREGRPMFTLDSLRILLAGIGMSDDNCLKSRRNKSQLSGIRIYDDYLADSVGCNEASETIRQMVMLAQQCPDTEELIPLVLAEYAIRFLIQAGRIQCTHITYPVICSYFREELSLDAYRPIIEHFFETAPSLSGSAPRVLEELLSFNLTHIPGQDVLGLLYISLKNLKERKATGTYYTPDCIVSEMLHTFINKEHTSILEQGNVLDPCCGTGNFILALLAAGVSPDRIYAQDNDSLSIGVARINMALNAEPCYLDTIRTQVICRDTLLETPILPQYDLVIGNPPWGFAFDKETVKQLRNHYSTCRNSSPESFHLFIEYGLSVLSEHGYLAYVLPEAIINVQTHQKIRCLLAEEAGIVSVTFRPDGFKNVQCPAIELIARKGIQGNIDIVSPDGSYTIYTDRNLQTASIWNLSVDDDEYNLLMAMDSCSPSMTLKGSADFALGIVTGSNSRFLIPADTINNIASDSADASADISDESEPAFEPIYKGVEVFRFGLAAPSNYITFTPSEFQQVAPEALYRAPEKLIYRFICNRPVFAYDNNQALTLNSANIMIPNVPQLSIFYLLGVLNSSTVQFYLTKTYHSLKLLRSHIESIPIVRASEAQQEPIIAVVKKLMTCNGNAGSDCCDEDVRSRSLLFYRQLNELVYALYGFTPRQIAMIEAATDYTSEAKLLLP